MKRGSTLFLKVAVFLIGIPILALCVFVVPELAKYSAEMFPDINYLPFFVYLYFYATAVPFYLALHQAFKLLSNIDQNQAFSELSERALKRIKYFAITISSLYVVGMPFFYIAGEVDDAPGVILMGLIIIFASTVIAVFAAVLQRLLQEANHIKSENDLTV